MGTWRRVRAALRRERRDVDDAIEELTARANATLDQKERELDATPAERLAIEQRRAKQIDADFEAIRRRIEGQGRPT